MRNGKTLRILSILVLAFVVCAPVVRADDEALPAAVPAISPGEKLMSEFDQAYGVMLGTNKKAPVLYAAIIPSSKDCKEFWFDIRDDVKKGRLRVKLYPAGLVGMDEMQSARLLEVTDAAKEWNKFVEGDKKALTGPSNKAALDRVHANTQLVERWRFPAAPYLLYRAKNGQVKVVQGKPADPQVIINDMTSAKPETKP